MSAFLDQLESGDGGPKAAARIRVLIADDHPLMLAGIRATLEHDDDIELVGEARSAPEVIGLFERRRPAIVLMDLRMPGVSGVELIERIRRCWPEMTILVLSACDERPTIDAALLAGANAYAVKSAEAADIISLLRQVSNGSVFVAPTQSSHRISPPARARAELHGLTEREQAILAAVASGKTTAAISRELWISQHTVKFHLTNIYRKLGVPNRAGAVRYALEHNLAAA